ncbi:MAG: hypothetical protein JKY31_07245 [Rhodobacteraceae bacterium]|nr:hypothetical protein [Paracoccaceae bacterium]
MSTASVELNTPDVIQEDFGDDMVLLNLRSGEYFNFSERSRAFIDAILKGVSPAELIGSIAEVNNDVGKEAENFYTLLEKHALIRPASTPVVPHDATLATSILAAGATFPFDFYDDLSDLIAADPIHDVAPEAGWPVRA